MRNRNQRLEKRGEAIARRTIRRAHMLWKLHCFINSHPRTLANYLVGRSKDRICAVVGVRYFSTFTLLEQIEAAQPFLQRFIDMDPELTTNRMVVVAGATGISMTPIWRSYWQVRPVNARV